MNTAKDRVLEIRAAKEAWQFTIRRLNWLASTTSSKSVQLKNLINREFMDQIFAVYGEIDEAKQAYERMFDQADPAFAGDCVCGRRTEF